MWWIIRKILLYVGVTVFLVMVITGIGSCIKEANEEQERIKAANKIYKARFPKTGDKILLNGEEIVILKKYVWARERRYEVRLADGSTTDVLGTEIIDKKPLE